MSNKKRQAMGQDRHYTDYQAASLGAALQMCMHLKVAQQHAGQDVSVHSYKCNAYLERRASDKGFSLKGASL